MSTEHTAGKPTTRRYSAEEKAVAVRMVRSLQAETRMAPAMIRAALPVATPSSANAAD